MNSAVADLPAFSDSTAQTSLPTDTLAEFAAFSNSSLGLNEDILSSGGLNDLQLPNINLDTNLSLGLPSSGLQAGNMDPISLPQTHSEPHLNNSSDINLHSSSTENILGGGSLMDLNLGDLGQEIKTEQQRNFEGSAEAQPQSLNLDNLSIPSNITSQTAPIDTTPLTQIHTTSDGPVVSQMLKWTVQDVQAWLQTKSFGSLYSQNFLHNNIDGNALLNLEENFMIENLGIKKVFHRIRILRDVADCLAPFDVNQGDGGPPYSRFLRFQSWDLVEWCKILPFGNTGDDYSAIFSSNNLTGEQIASIDANTLKGYGIKNLHGKRILLEIEDIRNGVPEPVSRVEQVWSRMSRTDSCYRLLYSHLKPRPRRKKNTQPGGRKRGRGRAMPQSPENWQVSDCIQWLDNFSWGSQYVENFKSCEVTGHILLRLTGQTLTEILHINPNHQAEMLAKIEAERRISLHAWTREPAVKNWLSSGHRRKKARVDYNNEPVAAANAPKCILCGKSDNIMRCSKCKKAFYCSREHQVQHWPEHAAECIPTD